MVGDFLSGDWDTFAGFFGYPNNGDFKYDATVAKDYFETAGSDHLRLMRSIEDTVREVSV
jgi:hypothetical protein